MLGGPLWKKWSRGTFWRQARLFPNFEAIDRGEDPNLANEFGVTALHKAVYYGDSDAVRKLLAISTVNRNPVMGTGLTPLMIASGNGRWRIVKQLLAAGANPNLATSGGLTALLLAAKGGFLGIVRQLLSAGANANAATENGLTALHLAARKGYIQIVEKLLASGADKNALFNGKTPLDEARAHKHMHVAELLETGPLMLAAAPAAAVEAPETPSSAPLLVQEMVPPAMARVREISPEKMVQLWNIALEVELDGLRPRLPLIMKAIESGANPAISGRKSGLTALHIAAGAGASDLVEKLLALPGVNKNAAMVDGVTPLMIASSLGRKHVVKQLLDAGANPNAAAVEGGTALYFASLGGFSEIVTLLLRAGANPNATFQGHTPLDAAMVNKHANVEFLLRSAGGKKGSELHPRVSAALPSAAVDERDANGQTPLIRAVIAGDSDLVQVLLDQGADPFIEDSAGLSARDYALDNPEMLTYIESVIERKPAAEVYVPAVVPTSVLSAPPSAAVAIFPSAAVVPVDERDAHGQTALMRAVIAGDRDLVEALLDQGADPLIEDSARLSARDYAQEYPEILRYIDAFIESKYQ